MVLSRALTPLLIMLTVYHELNVICSSQFIGPAPEMTTELYLIEPESKHAANTTSDSTNPTTDTFHQSDITSEKVSMTALSVTATPEGAAVDGMVTDAVDQSSLKPLHLLGLIPWDSEVFNAKAGLPGMLDALEQINRRQDILPGYKLVLDWEDSQCSTGPGINALFRLLYQDPPKIMILGAGCSIVCHPASDASMMWNLTTVSFTCTSPALSDRKRYPRFFRITGPDSSVIPARIEMMRQFNWTKVANLHQSYEMYAAVTERMLDALEEINATVLTSEVFQTDPAIQIKNLQRHDARIVFAGMYNDIAVNVVCEAFKAGFYGPHIVWFLFNWYPADWYHQIPPELQQDCTPADLLQVVDGGFYLGYSFENPFETRGVSGMTSSEFEQQYLKWTNYTKLPYDFYKGYFYDSVWASALALNATMNKLGKLGINRTLSDWKYSDLEMADLITQSMYEINFFGVMGPIGFDEFGEPSLPVAIEQQQGRNRVTVGYFRRDTGVIIWTNGGIKWRGGRVPADSSVIVIRRLFVSDVLYGILCGVAGIGVLATTGFLIFNIAFRKRKIIKMSSPNINNLTLVGCMLSYAAVFFVHGPNTERTGSAICVAQVFTFTIGFALSFGALFTKTWRVHVILTTSQKTVKRTVIKDSYLVAMVSGLVLIDVIILTVWQVVDPFQLLVSNLTAQANPSAGYEVIEIPQVLSCSSEYQTYFTGTLYALHGLLLAFGAFLAWETRKIKVEALNDSKLIGVCIYNVMLFSILGVAISYVIDSNVTAAYGFSSGFIIAGTSIIVWVIFLPKVMAVMRGKDVVGPLTSVGTTTGGSSTAG